MAQRTKLRATPKIMIMWQQILRARADSREPVPTRTKKSLYAKHLKNANSTTQRLSTGLLYHSKGMLQENSQELPVILVLKELSLALHKLKHTAAKSIYHSNFQMRTLFLYSETAHATAKANLTLSVQLFQKKSSYRHTLWTFTFHSFPVWTH